jgi:hypothetical protein
VEDDDEKKEAAPPPLTDCIPLSIRLGMIEFARLIAAEEVTETSRRSAGASDKPPPSSRGPCASAAVSHPSSVRSVAHRIVTSTPATNAMRAIRRYA